MASGNNVRKSSREMMVSVRSGKNGEHFRISAGGKLTATSTFGTKMINKVSDAALKKAGVRRDRKYKQR